MKFNASRVQGISIRRLFTLAPFLCLVLAGQPALSAETPVFQLRIKDHHFVPAVIEIPQGKKVKLEIRNEDATAEEFESHDLHREKMVPAGKTVVVYVGPLKPGSYSFFGEFNPKTARGSVVVK